MTAPSRAELVAQFVAKFRPQVHRALGMNIIGDGLVGEWIGMVALLAQEFAPQRQISAAADAMCQVLHECITTDGRVHATTDAVGLLDVLALEPEVDSTTAAELLGMKEDTLRKALRENRIEGTFVNGRWRIPVSAIDEYRAR